jgi:hypothetical protein
MKVPVVIGEQTCMGVSTDQPPPYRRGNQVSLLVDNVGPVHVTNLTAEHIDAALHGWTVGINEHDRVHQSPLLEDGKLWICLWEENGDHWCLVTDSRIPDDWYDKHLRWGRLPSTELATEIYQQNGGDPYGELEQFTDPVAYWAKRGWQFVLHDGKRALYEP